MTPARKAIVATGHPLVSAAAVDILKKGGNAFDAVIAAGFTGAVAEPSLTSLGGGGFLLAKTKYENGRSKEILFDFFVDTPGRGLKNKLHEPHFFPVTVHFPGSDQIFNVGLGSIAVPGNLKGFLHIHKRLGSLPLETILQPAVQLARNGVIVNESQAYFLDLLRPIMTFSETGRNLYVFNGQYISPPDCYTNPDLAIFLEQLPNDQGESFFYGELAAAMASDMEQGQGLLTVQDLASYQVIEREPFRVPYKEHILLTNPPPSFGGSLTSTALSILESFSLKDLAWGSPEHLTLIAGLMKEVDRIRENGLNDTELLKSQQQIRLWSKGTTHMSIADGEGNVASMTTSNGEGSGYFVPGTGIMLNNMMGEDDLHPDGFHASPPGERVSSMMAPSLMLHDDDVTLVFGSGGSKRIRTALLQVLVNTVDFKLDIQDAVIAPRMHWDGEILQVEPGLPEESTSRIKKLWPVNIWSDKDMYFGGVHAVIPGVAGGGDPRRGGTVMEIDLQGT